MSGSQHVDHQSAHILHLKERRSPQRRAAFNARLMGNGSVVGVIEAAYSPSASSRLPIRASQRAKMALTSCPDCGNQISTAATACPKCGRPSQEQTQQDDRRAARDLIANWDRVTDSERARRARELILRAAPGSPVETFGWGKLKDCVSDIAGGGDLPVIRQLSRTTAALLALFLGGLGVHRFYLGRAGSGILYLLFCWTFVPAFIALVEAIMLFSMTDADFVNRYCR
jgi:hypothetical protein